MDSTNINYLNLIGTGDLARNVFEYLTRAWKVVVKQKSVTSNYEGHKNLGWATNTYYSVQCIPKQSNSSDCGVFVTLYAKNFLRYVCGNDGFKGCQKRITRTVTKKMIRRKRFDKILGIQHRNDGPGYTDWFDRSCAQNERIALQNIIRDKKNLYTATLKSLEMQKHEAKGEGAEIKELRQSESITSAGSSEVRRQEVGSSVGVETLVRGQENVPDIKSTEEKNVHIVHDSLRAHVEKKKGPISYTDYDDDQTDDDQDKLEEPCPGAKTVVVKSAPAAKKDQDTGNSETNLASSSSDDETPLWQSASKKEAIV
eukprot:g15836.t1